MFADGLAGGSQLRPVNMPIRRPEQLTIEQAMGCNLQFLATGNRKASGQPAVDGLTRGANQAAHGALAAQHKKGVSKGGGMQHVDIVKDMSTKSQSNPADPVIKLGMDVWKHIEDELHRRRLDAPWLYRKLKVSRQVVSGWKSRGVPTKRYEAIAALFGWTIDRLVLGVDSEQQTPLTSATPASKPVTAEATYSPMALDLARQLDEINELEAKKKAYALMSQIALMSGGPSPLVPSPTAPDQQPAAPVAAPTPTPQRGR